MSRGRPGSPGVRKGSKVGPSYAEDRFEHPWNAELDSCFGSEDEKDAFSEAGSTFEGGGAPLEKGKYDGLWEGK
jgi:hypothetical protein